MALIAWNERLMLGVPAMDAQHQRLVELLNDLHEAMRRGEGNAVIGGTLKRLAEYAAVHFASEERYMQQIRFAKFAQHKAEHEQLTRQVTDLIQRLESGSAALSVEVFNFLKDWLAHHIDRLDREYSPAALGAPAAH